MCPIESRYENYPLQELAERTNKGIFIYNTQSNEFSYINPSFEDIWSKALEIFRNDPQQLVENLHPEDKDYVLRNFRKLIAGFEKNIELEFRINLPEGTQKWLSVKAYLGGNGTDKKFIAGFAEDITAMKLHLINAKKFAAKKDSVLEILAHDLAGPLSNIANTSTLLAEHLKEYDDPEFAKLLGIIEKTTERSIRLIREFVKQEFLESSHTDLIKKRVDLVRIIYDIINQYKNSEDNIAKTFNLSSSEPKVFVEIDDYKFSQVINNLISNAIKFTHDGGIIDISIEQKEAVVLVIVADNGIGIPDIKQEELFEKFTKARRPGLKGEPSVGLGMSIIKTIIDWHNGRIWFESEVNKGSVFYIELPMKYYEPLVH